MVKFIFKRLVTMIPVLLVVSILVFMMVHLMPGDAAKIIAGEAATEADIERVRVAQGFDRPLPEQYIRYIGNVLRGDMGTSIRTNRPVSEEIMSRLPNTLILAAAAILISIVVGISIGIISATKRYSIFDNFSMLFALFGLSIPPFYLGLMLMLLFSVMQGHCCLHSFPKITEDSDEKNKLPYTHETLYARRGYGSRLCKNRPGCRP